MIIPEITFFENRECQHYPCHDADRINCILCYCPLYHKLDCGGTFDLFYRKEGGYIKDCSLCTFPHKEENYQKVLDLLCTKDYIILY